MPAGGNWDHARGARIVTAPAVPAPSDETAYEFLCWLLRDPPHLEREDGPIKIRTERETYWVLSGVDLHALLAARQYVLARGAPGVFLHGYNII